MAHYEEIDYMRRDLYTLRFKNELEFLRENNFSEILEDGDNWMTERILHLEKILDTLEKEKEQMEKPTAKSAGTIFDEIDKYIYKKPWKKLQPFHRMKKIESYLEENIQDPKLRKELSKQFQEKLDGGKLGTEKHVEYDPATEKIISIPALIYNEEDKSYKIIV